MRRRTEYDIPQLVAVKLFFPKLCSRILFIVGLQACRRDNIGGSRMGGADVAIETIQQGGVRMGGGAAVGVTIAAATPSMS